jgi:hypothetical protein
LGHAVQRGEIADHVIRRDIDANLASRRANQVDGAFFGRNVPFVEKPREHWVVGCHPISFETTERARQHLHLIARNTRFLVRKYLLYGLYVLDGANEDDDGGARHLPTIACGLANSLGNFVAFDCVELDALLGR